jgi:hypothetical protein
LKLQAGNPNFMKVNKSVGLGTFAQTSGDLGQVKVRRGYVPTKRDPSLVPAPELSVWAQPTYKPDHSGYQRPGSDHSHIKRRGF